MFDLRQNKIVSFLQFLSTLLGIAVLRVVVSAHSLKTVLYLFDLFCPLCMYDKYNKIIIIKRNSSNKFGKQIVTVRLRFMGKKLVLQTELGSTGM